MSTSEPTHPLAVEDADDVQGHMYRRMALPADAVESHSPVDAGPDPEGLARVKGPQERAADDVEGHSYRRSVVGDDDDVEGHATRGRA